MIARSPGQRSSVLPDSQTGNLEQKPPSINLVCK
jgi:hypothetical protein